MGSSAANSTLVEQSGQSTDVAARLSIVTSPSQRTHSRVIMARAWGPVVTASVSQLRGRFTVPDVDAVVGINRRRYATNGIKDEPLMFRAAGDARDPVTRVPSAGVSRGT